MNILQPIRLTDNRSGRGSSNLEKSLCAGGQMWANVSKMWVKAPSKWAEAKCKDKSNFEITFGKHRDGTEEDLLSALS